jgi:hypothetical protein
LLKLWSGTETSYRASALVAFAACVTLCACSVFLLVIRTQPLHDDFCRASFFGTPLIGQRPGILHYTVSMYLNWTGRWAGVGVETLLLSTSTLPGDYPWLVFVLIATQCFLLYVAIWELVVDARQALYLSAVIASVYWATMPSPQQGIFWILGAVESQLPLTLGTLLFALVLSRRSTDTKQSTRRAAVAASILGFVTPAFHELAGGALVLALSVITVTAFLSKSSQRKMWLIVWTASAIGFVVVFVAPGNSVRMATISNRGNCLAVIKGSLVTARDYVLPWCLDFKHWLLAVLLWFNPSVASLRKKLSGLSSFGTISGFLLVWISLIMFAIGSTIWNLGILPPGRTMNLIYGIFLIGWIAFAFLVMPPDPRFSLAPARRAATMSATLFLLSALVVTSNNTHASIGDIVSGRARSWNLELNRRSALLKSAGPNADVLLIPLSERPNMLAMSDLAEDPNRWENRCVCLYFRVASVRITKATKEGQVFSSRQLEVTPQGAQAISH